MKVSRYDTLSIIDPAPYTYKVGIRRSLRKTRLESSAPLALNPPIAFAQEGKADLGDSAHFW